MPHGGKEAGFGAVQLIEPLDGALLIAIRQSVGNRELSLTGDGFCQLEVGRLKTRAGLDQAEHQQPHQTSLLAEWHCDAIGDPELQGCLHLRRRDARRGLLHGERMAQLELRDGVCR